MKKIIILIIIIVLVALGVKYYLANQAGEEITGLDEKNQEKAVVVEDTTAAITEGLEEINLGDLDAEFQEIDADLNSL